MKAIHWIIAAAAFAFVQSAQAAQTDPEVIIYRASGVIDTGSSAGVGVATVFQCTNISTAAENLRFVIRNFNAVIVANQAFSMLSFQTLTVGTHITNLYLNTPLAPGTSV